MYKQYVVGLKLLPATSERIVAEIEWELDALEKEMGTRQSQSPVCQGERAI